MKKIICFSLTAICLIQARADEKLTAIEEFRETTVYQLMMCRIETKTAIMQIEAGTSDDAGKKIGTCIRNGLAEAKKAFPAALAKVSKKPGTAKLLKDYYAGWVAALNGVSPGVNELRVIYEQRQLQADAKQDEAWSRFEIEAGL